MDTMGCKRTIGWLVVTGTMEWIMTFHSIGNFRKSQLTKSIICLTSRLIIHVIDHEIDDPGFWCWGMEKCAP